MNKVLILFFMDDNIGIEEKFKQYASIENEKLQEVNDLLSDHPLYCNFINIRSHYGQNISYKYNYQHLKFMFNISRTLNGRHKSIIQEFIEIRKIKREGESNISIILPTFYVVEVRDLPNLFSKLMINVRGAVPLNIAFELLISDMYRFNRKGEFYNITRK